MDGNFFLHLAATTFALVLLFILYKNYFNYKISTAFIAFLTLSGACFTIIAFIFLLKSYIISDLSYINVALNSHPALPLQYKIGALWGNHDGSLLLLTSYLALFIIIFYCLHNNYQFYLEILFIQVVIILACLVFLLTNANPLLRSFPVPISGLGLTPVLQDHALIIHPPILYLSHIGAIIIYSIALVVLKKQIPFNSFIKLLKPWLYISLSFSTLGIGLGSWWAYREIGWGGIWFWDPVETISLLPWLLFLAGIHSCNNAKLQNLLIFSSITSFITITLGMFLLRSGLINSIHSFATDLNKSYFLLVYLIFTCLFPLYYGGLNTITNKARNIPLNSILFYTVLLFIILSFILSISLLIPIIASIFHSKLVITAKFFNNITIICGYISLLILFYFYHNKKKTIINCILLFNISFYFFHKQISFSFFAQNLLIFIVTFFLAFFIQKKFHTIKSRDSLHLIFTLLIFALLTNFLFSHESNFEIQYNDTIMFLDKEIKVENFQVIQENNKLVKIVLLKVDKLEVAKPSLQIFPVEKQIISEPFIINNLFYDLFFSVQQLSQDKFLLNLQYKPMINFIWFTIIMLCIIVLQQAIKAFISYKSHT